MHAESLHVPWGAVGLGRCLVLWCRIFMPVENHTGLLLWQCGHPKLSTVWLAAAGLLYWRKGFFVLCWNNKYAKKDNQSEFGKL